MPYDIRAISSRDFLRTDVNGFVDFPISKKILAEIASACAENENHHILLDTREATTNLSATDVYELVLALQALGFGGNQHRIGVLNRPKDDFDRARFFELCARNRGFNVRAFRDFEEALLWLNS